MGIERRKFIAGSVAAAALAGGTRVQAEDPGDREYYEIRKILLDSEEKQKRFLDFLDGAYLPAAGRAGVEKIGVFTSYENEDSDVYAVTPFQTAAGVAELKAALLADKTFQEDGGDFFNAPFSDPAYTRMESSLFLAFKDMPSLEVPEKSQSRLYELRIYESHSVLYGQRKIHMFNEGKEIELFRETGLDPVFFGEALVGSRLPNLTYMITFEDMESHDKNWKTFIDHPDWKKLKGNPFYDDTVSNITKVILRAADCSQV